MKRLLVILLAFMLVFPFTAGVAASSNSPEKTAVAYMKCKFKCGCTSTGTGTMVAVNGLITSAHNLVCSDHNKSLKSCEFYFGQTKSGKYSYKYTGRFNFTWYADFSDGYKAADDIGYVVFPEDVGKKTGWYASSAESDSDLKWEHCHMFAHKGGTLISDWKEISVASSKQISWKIDSNFKKSTGGGPVYYNYEGLEYPTLVAVYTSYNGSKGYARRLTSKIFDDMRDDGVKFN